VHTISPPPPSSSLSKAPTSPVSANDVNAENPALGSVKGPPSSSGMLAEGDLMGSTTSPAFSLEQRVRLTSV
jgi:hypothetical protein